MVSVRMIDLVAILAYIGFCAFLFFSPFFVSFLRVRPKVSMVLSDPQRFPFNFAFDDTEISMARDSLRCEDEPQGSVRR